MNVLSDIRAHVGIFRRKVALSRHIHSVRRWKVLRHLGWTYIDDCFIAPACTFIGTDIHIGNGAYLNFEVFIDALNAPVYIGRHVHLGQRVMLITTSHEIGLPARRAGKNRSEPVMIGEGAWVGAGVTVLPGVTIGEGAVVGAGALVVEDVPAHGVYGGVPARLLRALEG